MNNDTETRLEQLDARVHRLESDLALLRAAAPPPPPPVPLPPRGAPLPSYPATAATVGPRAVALESEVVLKWGGVALVVLAVGFAVSTAISRGWIGPELQLLGALVVSLALIATGLRLRPTRLPWTHALCSGGVLALFTTVASDLFVDQTSGNTALVSTVLVALGGLGISRTVPSEWVGGVSLVGGTVAWLVIADGELPFHASLAWFALLTALGLMWSLDQGWFTLRVAGHVVGSLTVLWMAGEAIEPVDQLLVLGVASLLYASLVRLPSIGDLSSEWQKLEIQLATLAAPWAFAVVGVTLGLDGELVLGSAAIGVAAASVVVATALRRRIQPAHLVSELVGASVTLSIGLGIVLDTTTAFVAVALQGVGLVVLGRSLGGSIRMLLNAAVLLLIAATFVTADMIDGWTVDAPVGDDIAHLVIVVAILAAALLARREVQALVGASGLALILIWLGSVLVHLPQGQAAVPVSWAAVGTAVLLVGALRKVPELGGAGLAVLAVTVAKLLTVDLQEVDTLWRAGLFFMVGLGLMRLGFLLPRLTGPTQTDVRQPLPDPAPSPVGSSA